MEEKNNNMEEFFQRSLEQFNEVPSNQVWDKIDERLDGEQKWYKNVFPWFRTLLPLFLAIILLGCYHVFSSNKINTSNKYLLSAQETIQKLEKENQRLSFLAKENNEKINTYTQQIQFNETQYNSLLDQYSSLKVTDQKSEKLFKSDTHFGKAAFEDLLSLNEDLTNELSSLKAQMNVLQSENRPANKILSNTRLNAIDKNYNFLIPKNATYYYPVKDIILINSLKDIEGNMDDDFLVEEPDQISNNRKFRFGFKARYFNTLVKSSELINPGFSWGLRAEYQLRNKWFLTSDLHYNDQVYRIDPGAGGFSQESLKKYPLGIDDTNSVKDISTRTKYFDYKLGIKYLINPAENKFNFYVNPSIVWQLYLPQEYTYGLARANDIFHTQREYTGYLGSGNLSLGIERNLNNRMLFQLNLWGEQSFIELGYDKQYVTMFGIGSSILF